MMEIFYQTRICYLKLVSYLGLESTLEIRYPIKVGIRQIGKRKEETYDIQADIQIISRKISYLICPDNPTFHKHNDVQVAKVYQYLKENLTNLTFWGRK